LTTGDIELLYGVGSLLNDVVEQYKRKKKGGDEKKSLKKKRIIAKTPN